MNTFILLRSLQWSTVFSTLFPPFGLSLCQPPPPQLLRLWLLLGTRFLYIAPLNDACKAGWFRPKLSDVSATLGWSCSRHLANDMGRSSLAAKGSTDLRCFLRRIVFLTIFSSSFSMLLHGRSVLFVEALLAFLCSPPWRTRKGTLGGILDNVGSHVRRHWMKPGAAHSLRWRRFSLRP